MHAKLSVTVALLITIALTAVITNQPSRSETAVTAPNPSSAPVKTQQTFNTTPAGTLFFSGYTWKIRNSPRELSTPGPNYWSNSTSNVWVDGNGYLHLKITCKDGKWVCPEVYTLQALGYGTYVFHTASPIDCLDKNVVLGLFTYKDDSHEVDIEYSRWGKDNGFNSGFTVQPAPYTSENSADFNTRLTETEATHAFTWRSDKVTFKTVQGNYYAAEAPQEKVIKTWESKVSCEAADAKAVVNLWLYSGLPPSNLQEVEVVITGFEFYPF